MEDVKEVLKTSALESILTRFKKIRSQTEQLCSPLQTEDYVVQPLVDVTPPKWHLGHTTWFFEEFILSTNKEDYQRFHPEYAYIFNSYYETVGRRVLRTNRGNLTRPSVSEVYKYREYVNQQLYEYLEKGEVPDDVLSVIELGLQQEQQYQELLVYDIKYILGGNPLFPAYTQQPEGEPVQVIISDAGWLKLEEGIYQVGCEKTESFCYDNELGVHKVFLPACKIMNCLVTNEEYMAFMEAGGYQDFRCWLQEGWEWVKQEGVEAPFHWHRYEGSWHRFGLHGLEKVNPQAPVSHVSFYEADAFANWRSMRLPTEYEWEVACRMYSPEISQQANLQDSKMLEPIPQQQGNCQLYGDL